MTEDMPDLSGLLAQAQQVQAQFEEAQRQLSEERVTGRSGGGLVTATMSASGELVGVTISPAAVDPSDTETLADLVLAAYRDASQQATQRQHETMGPLAGGLGGLPGM